GGNKCEVGRADPQEARALAAGEPPPEAPPRASQPEAAPARLERRGAPRPRPGSGRARDGVEAASGALEPGIRPRREGAASHVPEVDGEADVAAASSPRARAEAHEVELADLLEPPAVAPDERGRRP